MNWIEQLFRWIEKLFWEKEKKCYTPAILNEQRGKYCTVYQIERSTPGAVATYRIVSTYGDRDYLLTLDYLPDVHGEIVGGIKLGSYDYKSHPCTHRFGVFALLRNGAKQPVGVWDVDLQGFGQNYNLAQIAPWRAFTGVAWRSLQLEHDDKTPSSSWDAQMREMLWLGVLEQRIRLELGNQKHCLREIEINY